MKEATIQHVLETGTQLILKKGFNNVGLKEILATAKIPKGSFYYYFKSKEDFGLKVIEYYSESSLKVLKSFLTDPKHTPKERFLVFFATMRDVYQTKTYNEGCLMGNCSLELSDIKESYAQTLTAEFDKWQVLFHNCIEAGKQDGSVTSTRSTEDLAAFILNSWEGTLLRMKITKSGKPIDLLISFVKDIL